VEWAVSIVWHLQAIEVWQASCKRDNVVCPLFGGKNQDPRTLVRQPTQNICKRGFWEPRVIRHKM